MSFERKRGESVHPDYLKAKKEVMKEKRIKVSVIFNQKTHRLIKAIASVEGIAISDLLEDLAQKYLREKGKI